MSHQPQYTTIVREAFNLYLDNKIDLDELIERLRYVELQVQSEEEEESDRKVWFRFFEGDTLKTTIDEIEKDLRDPAHPGGVILKRGIAYGLDANELEVHYS
ncbi:hypothetical protein ACSX1A_03945 [Pontibacter sp. MBLB2868]|uniref:hypothetical protein n=1 Tax=Pontibacter sp. MBLB2868 TaxID=3451555 RepID=UPI003F7564D9